MTELTANNEKKIRFITERFCSALGDNAVIVTTHTLHGEEQCCLYADKCNDECEHRKGR